jgi:hypothetical protein
MGIVPLWYIISLCHEIKGPEIGVPKKEIVI